MGKEQLARLVHVLQQRGVQSAALVGVPLRGFHAEADQCKSPRDQHLRKQGGTNQEMHERLTEHMIPSVPLLRILQSAYYKWLDLLGSEQSKGISTCKKVTVSRCIAGRRATACARLHRKRRVAVIGLVLFKLV
jgi:hypothetical protein